MMWGSRFAKPPDEIFARLNNSFQFDWRLYDEDLQGSQAYASALARAGIVSENELQQILQGLEQIRREFAAGEFEPQPGDEDIHTAVERRLFDFIGEAAHKLHTGRSRNDQVATDTRLYVMHACTRLDPLVRDVQRELVSKAEVYFDVLMPGYTHLRRAQPILFSHYLLSFFWMLRRDGERFDATRKSASVLPLGAGALAGSAFPLDRELLARELGFDRVGDNSLDDVADRDYILEFLFAASVLQLHLSRLAEDLIIYSSAEFGFVELDDAYTTGSSLMPQKKNPDSLELLRGKTGRVIGDLNALLVTLKGLPSSYDKDFQEDKEPLFDAVDTLELTLPVLAGLVRTISANTERMQAALDESMLATDLADYLVMRGIAFRQAHRIVGQLVKHAAEKGIPLSKLSPDDYRVASPAFGDDIRTVFDFQHSLRQREITGGTGPEAVRRQLEKAKELLA